MCTLSHVPILCDPMGCSPPGSSVYGIFQARILQCLVPRRLPHPTPIKEENMMSVPEACCQSPSPLFPKGSCPPRISHPGFVQLAFNSDKWDHKGCVLLCVWVLHSTWCVWDESWLFGAAVVYLTGVSVHCLPVLSFIYLFCCQRTFALWGC